MSISPPAAAARIPAASSPPGRGRRPSCSAPTTLPRRSAGSTVTSGCTAATASYTARTVAAADCVDSARFARPATIDDGAAAQLVDDERVGERRRSCCRATGFDPDRAPGQRRQSGRHRSELDEPRPLPHGAVAQPQVEDGQLLLEIRADKDHRRCGGGALDRRPRQVEDLGRQPVSELCIAVLDAEGVGELGPGEGVLVGPPGAAEQGDALRSPGVDRGAQRLGDGGEGDGPRGLGELDSWPLRTRRARAASSPGPAS